MSGEGQGPGHGHTHFLFSLLKVEDFCLPACTTALLSEFSCVTDGEVLSTDCQGANLQLLVLLKIICVPAPPSLTASKLPEQRRSVVQPRCANWCSVVSNERRTQGSFPSDFKTREATTDTNAP